MRVLKAPIASFALLLAAMAIAQVDQSPPPPAEGNTPATKLAKLRQEFNAAMSKYYEPYSKAKTEEEAAKIKLDPAKNPAKEFMPKFKAFAKEHGKTDVALDAWMMVRQTAQNSEDSAAELEAIDAMLTDFIDSPRITVLVGSLQYGLWSMPPDERSKKIDGLIQRVLDRNKAPAVQASALYTRASLIKRQANGEAKAVAILRDIIAKYPDTPPGKSAKGDIFEIENLSVGKTAPDFQAEDEKGLKFKLSDYRGKVVVLDFWGFW